jgi:hypothetical protein
MVSGLAFAQAGAAAPMQFRVLGPDSGGPSPTDVRRLFRGQRMTAARRARLGQSGRMIAMCGTRIVGLAAYERSERELRVTELGLDHDSPCGIDQIASGLLDSLELACMASDTGGRATAASRVRLPRGWVRRELVRKDVRLRTPILDPNLPYARSTIRPGSPANAVASGMPNTSHARPANRTRWTISLNLVAGTACR